MGKHRVRPGRWRRATGPQRAVGENRAPYRAEAPDPDARGAPTVEESGRYLALGENRLWRRVRLLLRSLGVLPVVLISVSGLVGCDAEDEASAPESSPLVPAETVLEPPAESSIVHGEVTVVAAPVPTTFRGPFPVSQEALQAGTWAYVPWTYAHAQLCAGDDAVRATMLDALREGARIGELQGDLDGNIDTAYYNQLVWCRTDAQCQWLAHLAANEVESEVQALAWQAVIGCATESVRFAIDAEHSPDEIAVQWYTMMGAGGETVPPRIALAAQRIIRDAEYSGMDHRTTALADLLVRFSDPSVAERFDELLSLGDPQQDRELLAKLVRSPEPWAEQRTRRPCRRGELSQDQCLPPAHPYDPYLFEEPTAFKASVARFERTVVLDRLEACVFSRDSVDTYYRARCLTRLADLDWRRGAGLVASLEQDIEDAELGPVIRVLREHGDAPLQVGLRKHGLISSSPDPHAPIAEGIDALSVLTRYGRAHTAGTGIYTDVFDQAWSLHDLANLDPSLRGGAFDVIVDPNGSGIGRRIVAYVDGQRYTYDFDQNVDTDGIAAMLAMLNGILAHRERPERFVVARMDDYGVAFVRGDAAALRVARDAGVIDFYGPDSF